MREAGVDAQVWRWKKLPAGKFCCAAQNERMALSFPSRLPALCRTPSGAVSLKTLARLVPGGAKETGTARKETCPGGGAGNDSPFRVAFVWREWAAGARTTGDASVHSLGLARGRFRLGPRAVLPSCS